MGARTVFTDENLPNFIHGVWQAILVVLKYGSHQFLRLYHWSILRQNFALSVWKTYLCAILILLCNSWLRFGTKRLILYYKLKLFTDNIFCLSLLPFKVHLAPGKGLNKNQHIPGHEIVSVVEESPNLPVASSSHMDDSSSIVQSTTPFVNSCELECKDILMSLLYTAKLLFHQAQAQSLHCDWTVDFKTFRL